MARTDAGLAALLASDPDTERRWHDYCRWAIGPLMTRKQWDADQALLLTDFPAWCKQNGIG